MRPFYDLKSIYCPDDSHVINVGEPQYCTTQVCDLFSFGILAVTRRNKQLYLTLSFTTTLHVGAIGSKGHVTISSPVHLVIRNDANNSSNTDSICQAVPEQWPTGETPCLIKETKKWFTAYTNQYT